MKLNRWVYAIVGVVALLMAGIVYAWSVMSGPIAVEFVKTEVWTNAQLSLTFTLVMAFFCVGCLIAGFLAKKVSPKIYVLISAVLFLIGFFVASLTGVGAETSPMLYLGFGVICGLGAGFAYNAVMSTMSLWFPDKQGLISGILLMGFGLSAFIIGKIYSAVTPDEGGDWRFTFKMLAIILCVVLVICSFFFVKPGADFNPAAGTAKKKVVRQPASDITPGQMIRKPAFWLYYVWAIVISGAGLALVAQSKYIAAEVGGDAVSVSTIATVAGLISIFNGVGRILFGALFDKVGYKLTMLIDMVVFILASVILILALTTGNFALIVIGFIVGGLAYSGVTPTNSALISDFFGRSNYAMNFSLINTNLIIASFASTISGKLRDATGSYMSTLLMMIVLTVVGFIAFVFIKRPSEKK